MRSHSPQTHREFYSDDRDLRGHLERRAQQAILGKNSVQRQIYSTEYDMEIQNLERRNSDYALFESQRELESQRQFLEDIQWTDQVLRKRISLCSELEMKSRLHQEYIARSCREFEKLKRRCYQEENTEKQRILEEILLQHDQESRTVSLFFDDPDLLSSFGSAYVLHQALVTSSSRKPSHEVGMLRNTLENMSIPGNVF